LKIYKLDIEEFINEFYLRKESRSTSRVRDIFMCFRNDLTLKQKSFLYFLNYIMIYNEKIKFLFNRDRIYILNFLDYYQPLLITHFVNFIKLNKKMGR